MPDSRISMAAVARIAIVAGSLAVPSCDSRKHSDVNGESGGKAESRSPASATDISRLQPKAKPASPVKDWEQFREQVRTTRMDDLQKIYSQIRQSLKSDPLGTLDGIDKLSPGSRRDVLLRDIFTEYPRDRHPELIAWADKSALAEDKQLLHLILNVSSSGLDPKQTLGLYAAASDAKTKRLLAKFSAQQSVAGGANSLSQCQGALSQLSAEDQKTFIQNFASYAIYKDLVKGGAMIMAAPEQFGSGPLYDLGTTSGSKDPAATQQAIVEFSTRTGDRVALGAFVNAWFTTDSIEASQWATTLPEPLRNEAYLQLANQLNRKGATDEARKFAEGITDEAMRKKAGAP